MLAMRSSLRLGPMQGLPLRLRVLSVGAPAQRAGSPPIWSMSDGLEELRERLRRAAGIASKPELEQILARLPEDLRKRVDERKGARIGTLEEQSTGLELRPSLVNPNGVGCFASRAFRRGETIARISGPIDDKPDFESLQVREGQFLHMERPAVLMNHWCSPNAYIDWDALEFKALRDVAQGEQVTWNYNTSEWELQRPFTCHCCERKIRGFRHVEREESAALLPFLSPFIKSKVFSCVNSSR